LSKGYFTPWCFDAKAKNERLPLLNWNLIKIKERFLFQKSTGTSVNTLLSEALYYSMSDIRETGLDFCLVN
jgi:hypothetical protein